MLTKNKKYRSAVGSRQSAEENKNRNKFAARSLQLAGIKKPTNEKRQLRAAMVIVLFLFSVITPFPSGDVGVARADELDDLNNELAELNNQIQTVNDQLAAKRAEKKTLENEIAIFDGQIYSLQLQINATQAEINKLEAEIKNTEVQIAEAEAELERQKQILYENLRLLYEEGQTTSIEIVASSDNFSEFMDRTEYLKAIQDKISETMDKIEQLKEELEAQKNELEAKKTEQLSLKNSLNTQKNELSSQRVAKNTLLTITKGEEAAFQDHLAAIEGEIKKVNAAIWSIINAGNYISLGHVDQGSIIGYIGNSGYSTGCHLHFEVRSDATTHVNPSSYIGNGYFINPVQGVAINVPYGYSSFYFPGVFHTGQDYADGCAGTTIKASASGEIIKRVTGRPNTYPWSYEYGNYVIVAHDNGFFTLYAHLQ